MSVSDPAIPPPPTRPLSQRLVDMAVWGAVLALLVIGYGPSEIGHVPLLVSNSEHMREFLGGFAHPDFSAWKDIVAKMWLTVEIALWGTALAVLIAIPLGLAGAKNVSPPWLQQPVRWVMNILRAIPDLVIAYIFLVAVGPGPLPGVLALALNTGGVLGKLFSEAVESIDKGPVEGVRATGAAPLQEMAWGILPQVGPLWTSYGLYRFESNARSATVLGLIGAGGIGQLLFDSLNAFNFAQTAAIVIVIAVAVTLIDLLSQAMRSRLL